jgi:uroporphyrinogen decarboxylase
MDRNPAENFRQIIRHERADWIPFTLDVGAAPGFTTPIMSIFREKTGHDQPEEFFDYDFRTASLKARFGGSDPAVLHASVEPGTVFDEWGIGHWAGDVEGTYERTFPPLANAATLREIEAIPTPIIEVGDTAKIVEAYRARRYPVFGYSGSIYEWSWWLRGMQNFMMDMLDRPEFAEATIRKVTDYTKRLALESARVGIDVLCFYDDAGMQTGLQIAPELWRQFIKPRWGEILEAVRSQYPGTVFFLHSCGQIEAIIPDIIELGFHILHPLQPECMDYGRMRRTFGRDIVLCATMSAQNLFPFGTPDDIRKWVGMTRDLCASDNCAILCPSNRIQPETPWENILAFAEAARSSV